MAFTHTKKVDIESFMKARIQNRIRSQTSGSGSDQKGPGYATLPVMHLFKIKKREFNYNNEYFFVRI
jgi:hypothetical protein